MSKSVSILKCSKRKLASIFVEIADEYYVSILSSEGKLNGTYEAAVRYTAGASFLDDLRYYLIHAFISAVKEENVPYVMELSSILSRRGVSMCSYHEVPTDLVLSQATSKIVAMLDTQ